MVQSYFLREIFSIFFFSNWLSNSIWRCCFLRLTAALETLPKLSEFYKEMHFCYIFVPIGNLTRKIYILRWLEPFGWMRTLVPAKEFFSAGCDYFFRFLSFLRWKMINSFVFRSWTLKQNTIIFNWSNTTSLKCFLLFWSYLMRLSGFVLDKV